VIGRDGKPLVPQAEAVGTTTFFVSEAGASNVNSQVGDVTTDERQAVPLAAEDLATRLTSQLTEGW